MVFVILATMMGMSFYFILPIEYGVHDTCGRTIDGMDKIYDGHVGCNTQNNKHS